jgi:surface antigen
MHRVTTLIGLPLVLSLAACGGAPYRQVGNPAPVECAPFARALSGIDVHGDAADWWWRAGGRYPRGNRPETGSVMVFAPSPRLPQGHVAVVSDIVSPREILVTQANWVHRVVTTDQMVRDVSYRGDWSQVRVWWPPGDALGATVYSVLGFIYSGYKTNHDDIVRAVPRAVRVALGE